MGFPVLLGGLLLAVAVMSDKKKAVSKKPGRGDPGDEEPFDPPVDDGVLDAAMGACIDDAAPAIAARIVWTTPAQQNAWAVELSAGGFTKSAQCLSFQGEDLAACIGLLDAALAADLRAMAEPHRGAVAFAQIANKLDADGFPEGAACFRPSGPRAGLVSMS